MWTVYCPSLYNTGLVSTATGYLDLVSYMAAAASNAVFANALNESGWEKVIIVWTCIMALGIVAMVADWVHSKQRINS